MNDCSGQLAAVGAIPVVTLDDADMAADLGRALVAGGLPVIEVTLRTAAGLAAVERLAAVPGLLVGAGTVLDPRQVDAVADAGARFVVSPGLSADVVHRTRQRGLLPLPGVATPTELQAALRLELDLVKVFPAASLGGPAFLDALAAPFPGVRFAPSGGITAESGPEYLRRGSVLAVGGSWMVAPAALRAGRFDEIEEACRRTVAWSARR